MSEIGQNPYRSASARGPNFFVVGASRAGTTSLWDYLGQHPEVFFPAAPYPKEPSHFCDLTPVWAHKYRDAEAYLRGFDGATAKARGDASTTYLPPPESPMRIRESVPDAKIVILLRNPADRAFSLYSLLCQLGFEWITSFERALEVEDDRYENEDFKHSNPFWYYAYLYFRSGLYSAQVDRYLTAFPREQVKIILYDSLRRRPVETSQEVFGFLDVDPTFEPETAVHNSSSFPLSVRVQHLITEAWSTHPLKGAPERGNIVDRVLGVAARANLRLGRWRRHVFEPSTRRELLRRFEPDILRTGDIIGLDLGPWTRGDEVATWQESSNVSRGRP